MPSAEVMVERALEAVHDRLLEESEERAGDVSSLIAHGESMGLLRAARVVREAIEGVEGA